MPAQNLIVYAKWTVNQYTITFNSNGGTSVNTITQDFNTPLTQPSNPTRLGYSFLGWYADNNTFNNAYTFSASMPSESTTLYAKWNQPTVSAIRIEGSYLHSKLITNTGEIYSWGYNDHWGQLGIGVFNQSSSIPVKVEFPALQNGEGIIDTGGGLGHSHALTNFGRVFAWGHNGYGQLGDGTRVNSNIPIIIQFNGLNDNEIITDVSQNEGYHSLALTNQGRVFTWGYNNAGQLGNGTQNGEQLPTTPTLISFPSLEQDDFIVSLQAGYQHSLAVSNLGKVFSWGMNHNGELGDGTLINSFSPKNITISGLLSNEKIESVFATFGDSFALSNLGRVYAWGNNAGGTLGIGNTTVKRTTPQRLSFTGLQTGEFIQKLSNGPNHSLALTNLGKLYVWGDNYRGQLGDGSGPTSNKSSPTVLSMTNYLTNETIIEISCGESTSFVITSTGKLLVWGDNRDGELGLGDQNQRRTPTLLTISL
jgi:uncharacterized repeat protein (TIGR02543 family)